MPFKTLDRNERIHDEYKRIDKEIPFNKPGGTGWWINVVF